MPSLERARIDAILPAVIDTALRGAPSPGAAGPNRETAMITKFDSLFAGHADLDNVGYGGTPINERRYPNAHLATALEQGREPWPS